MLGGGWLLLGRGGEDSGDESSSVRREAQQGETARVPEEPTESEKVLPSSSCDPGLSNCVVASGRVLYVERVDPDGDGDAHFVTASKEGVTLPGITIFDVRTDLRPDPLPGPGDLVGGAGPVYEGHAGQKQIQVEEFHVAK